MENLKGINLKELSSKELSILNGGIVWVPIAIKAGKVIVGALTVAATVDAAIDFACGVNETIE
jgi:hypothetical protein